MMEILRHQVWAADQNAFLVLDPPSMMKLEHCANMTSCVANTVCLASRHMEGAALPGPSGSGWGQVTRSDQRGGRRVSCVPSRWKHLKPTWGLGYFFLPCLCCFPATTAELSCCHRDHLACKAKNIYYLAFYKKTFTDFC